MIPSALLLSSGVEAFRWTSGGGMVGLGDLPGGISRSKAYDVSSDGTVVVGIGRSASGDEAFIWDNVNGMRNLRDVLISDHGLDLTGWTLQDAHAVSDDGTLVVGYGRNPSGDTEAWLADLSNPIPEPFSAATLAMAVCGLRLYYRRKRRTAQDA